MKKQANAKFLVILIYVDDMIVVGNDVVGLVDRKKYLHIQFHIQDLCDLKYFLVLEFASSSKGSIYVKGSTL